MRHSDGRRRRRHPTGLQTLLQKAEEGTLEFSVDYEDIHLNIEKMLIEEIGPLGGKLHTGRSRNDQVATDMHLYLKDHVSHIIVLIEQFQKALIEKRRPMSRPFCRGTPICGRLSRFLSPTICLLIFGCLNGIKSVFAML